MRDTPNGRDHVAVAHLYAVAALTLGRLDHVSDLSDVVVVHLGPEQLVRHPPDRTVQLPHVLRTRRS